MERIEVLNVPTVSVDRLRPGELRDAATVLATSFVREPLFAYLLDGREGERIVRAVAPWFRAWIRTYARYGHVHTARRDGQLVGVGIRVPPDGHELPAPRKLAFMARIMGSVLRMAAVSPRARQLFAVGSAVERREPSAPFWLFAWAGVLPEHQRCGVGSALADEAVRVVDRDGGPAWLVTFGGHTRAMYERRGFVVEGEIEPLVGGPVGWTLRRDAAKGNARD